MGFRLQSCPREGEVGCHKWPRWVSHQDTHIFHSGADDCVQPLDPQLKGSSWGRGCVSQCESPAEMGVVSMGCLYISVRVQLSMVTKGYLLGSVHTCEVIGTQRSKMAKKPIRVGTCADAWSFLKALLSVLSVFPPRSFTDRRPQSQRNRLPPYLWGIQAGHPGPSPRDVHMTVGESLPGRNSHSL